MTETHAETHDPFSDTPIADVGETNSGYRGCLYLTGIAVMFWTLAGCMVWLIA